MNVTKKSFDINLRLMQLFCLYPPEKPTRLFKVCSIILYIFLTLPLPVLSSLYLVLEKNISVERVGDNAFAATQTFVTCLKYIPFIVNGNRIKKCINFFEYLPSFATTEKQKLIIDKTIRICRRNSRTFLKFMGCGYIMWVFRPFSLTETRFPVDIWFPINPYNELKIYCFIYLHMALGVAYSAFSSAAIDPLIGGLACLASAYTEIINDKVENLDKHAEEILNRYNYHPTVKKAIKAKIIHDEIRKCVSYYKTILDFSKEYEDCFSPVVFSQFVGGCVVLCFFCFQLKLLDPLSFAFFRTIVFFLAVLTLIYFYCYYGTRIFEKSEALTNAIYLGNWYDYDIKSKKALLILMERSQRPIRITAGKLMDLSVETFAAILQKSYSLFAVLQNIQY